MKNIVEKFTIILVVVLHSVCEGHTQKAGSEFRLNGIIKGRDTGVLYFRYLNNLNQFVRDTTYLINGRFTFSGKITQPTYATLYGRKKVINNSQVNFLSFFLEPRKINIFLVQDDDTKAKISGSRSQVLLESYYINRDIINRKYKHLDSAIFSMQREYSMDTGNISLKLSTDSLQQLLKKKDKDLDSITLSFILHHTHEYISAFLFQNLILTSSVQECLTTFNKLSPKIKNSNYGIISAKAMHAKQGWSINSKASNFRVKDIFENSLELSSFNGTSYVLLDFWATWCVPCRKGSPNLIKWYNSYHNQGLEIIGIANDDTRKEAWKTAIAKDNMEGWRHILQGVGTENDIGKLYAVQAIPDKILIDKNGVIIYRQVGDNDDELEKKLKKIFDK